MAEIPRWHFPQDEKGKDSVRVDTVSKDTTLSVQDDTLSMDSLQKAIWKHNKAIDDSLRADSLNRERKNGIDAPVSYQADDSMTYEGGSGIARLFGNAQVKYQDMDLQSDKIYKDGLNPLILSAYRAKAPIFAITKNEQVARHLSLVWNVQPVFVVQSHDTRDLIQKGIGKFKEMKFLFPGDTVVISGDDESSERKHAAMVSFVLKVK